MSCNELRSKYFVLLLSSRYKAFKIEIAWYEWEGLDSKSSQHL